MTRKSNRHPLVEVGDAALAATELGHAALARLMSPAAGDRLAQGLAGLATRLRPGKRRGIERLYAEMVGDDPTMPPPESYVRALMATLLQQRMVYARLGRDAGWRPDLVVTGADHVADALAARRGVVLWVLPLEMATLLVRMVLADRGWPLPFMSHWRHGQSTSRLGVQLLNARDCRVEERFGPRLVMTDDATGPALAEARRLLGQGGMVGFRGIGWTKRPATYPLFAGTMDLAFGAPVIARRTGAALFVVAAARTAEGFAVDFRPMDGVERRPAQDLGAEFAAHLERAARASPSLWSVRSRQWRPGAPGDGSTVGS